MVSRLYRNREACRLSKTVSTLYNRLGFPEIYLGRLKLISAIVGCWEPMVPTDSREPQAALDRWPFSTSQPGISKH